MYLQSRQSQTMPARPCREQRNTKTSLCILYSVDFDCKRPDLCIHRHILNLLISAVFVINLCKNIKYQCILYAVDLGCKRSDLVFVFMGIF